MSSFKVTGLDKLEKQLKQMQKGAKELGNTKHIPLGELFTAPFMQKYTNFASIDELFTAGGFNATTQEDFENISEIELDQHIAASTKFTSWDDMLSEATSQYVSKKLGL